MSAHVTVEPAVFSFVDYDADTIATLTADLAGRLGLGNPITVDVDESTPLGKLSATVDGDSSDALITITAESGALENSKRLTTFGEKQARLAIGRMLLRARDRLRSDFDEAPADHELSLRQSAAWDTYCVGRLVRIGLDADQQRFRYNFRNRFGFSDDVDAVFDRLWAADDLAWSSIDEPS